LCPFPFLIIIAVDILFSVKQFWAILSAVFARQYGDNEKN
jgi:hypothetical protein